MFKLLNYLFFIGLLVFSCSSGGGDDSHIEEPQDIIPTNLVLQITIAGVDSNNINGDGSGIITCTATATNAVKYGFKFESGTEQESSNGIIEHTFTTNGTNNYLITVFAYSSTGNVISTFKSVDILVSNLSGATWSDEFNGSGAPNSAIWAYDLGDGGWGNAELQTYTNSSNNVFVSNGTLKIKAIKDGNGYTSARIKTQGLYTFKYGRIDVRAKLPASAGTWPAIWMLGSSFTTVGWPRCGEIDIMEQTGWDKNKVLGTCHWFDTASANTASYGLNTNVTNVSTQFHVYSIEWNVSSIKIYLDNVKYYEIALNATLPFNAPFFIILNVAMGGSLGGAISSGFTEDTMEIDYVRVFQ